MNLFCLVDTVREGGRVPVEVSLPSKIEVSRLQTRSRPRQTSAPTYFNNEFRPRLALQSRIVCLFLPGWMGTSPHLPPLPGLSEDPPRNATGISGLIVGSLGQRPRFVQASTVTCGRGWESRPATP